MVDNFNKIKKIVRPYITLSKLEIYFENLKSPKTNPKNYNKKKPK